MHCSLFSTFSLSSIVSTTLFLFTAAILDNYAAAAMMRMRILINFEL
jgi:hypothetical protein